ncbi:MAG: hypothetical protein RIS47_1029, partial [Bacteroidota bacterium]
MSSISAQSICKGKVVQDDAQGLSGCSVSFRDGRRVLAFSYTQDDGHFQLTIPANFDTLTLRVSSLGYTTYQSTRAVGEFTQSELIRLAFDVQRLQEVLIKDLSPIVQHNDTTKYKVEAFRDSTERTAEDLLKKLPGIRVSPNGQIQFNNRSVQTVLLNGENMVGSSYTLITRTLAARSIAEIQVIGHYAENPILKMMEGSDAYAVNLVTHEGLKFSGTAQLTGGIPEKYDVGENSILLRNNVRWLNNTHWGNSKLKLSVDPDLGAADPNEANLRYQSGAEQNYLSDFEAQTTEQKHLSHSDVFGITLSANWKINANLLYNQSRLNRDETSETTYNLLQQDFSLVETNKQALSNNQLRGELSSTYCDYRANWFRVNIRQQQVAVRNALSYQNADNLFPSLSKTTALQSLVTAQWTRKLSDLVFSNLELVAILPQSDTEKTALAYQPILNLPEKLVDMRQNKQHHENLFLLKEVVGIRLGNLRFLTELNYTTGKVAAESELHFLTNDHTSWNRMAATQYNNLKLAQAITYNTDKLDVQAKAGGQVANYHDNFLGTNAQPVRQWQPVIQVDVVRKFKRRNAISLSYSNV